MKEFKFNIPADNTPTQSKEIRENFEVLATNNVTADPAYPKQPRNGMARILSADATNIMYQIFWGSWRTIFQNIESGESQARRKEQTFQNNVQWIFDHNLNTYPLVQVLDEYRRVIIPEDIQHASVNRVIVSHSVPISGRIIVIG